MFYGPYKCKNKNEIQHFINMAILNEDYISNLSELMGVIKVDSFLFWINVIFLKILRDLRLLHKDKVFDCM